MKVQSKRSGVSGAVDSLIVLALIVVLALITAPILGSATWILILPALILGQRWITKRKHSA